MYHPSTLMNYTIFGVSMTAIFGWVFGRLLHQAIAAGFSFDLVIQLIASAWVTITYIYCFSRMLYSGQPSSIYSEPVVIPFFFSGIVSAFALLIYLISDTKTLAGTFASFVFWYHNAMANALFTITAITIGKCRRCALDSRQPSGDAARDTDTAA
jgi:hypothetical protein